MHFELSDARIIFTDKKSNYLGRVHRGLQGAPEHRGHEVTWVSPNGTCPKFMLEGRLNTAWTTMDMMPLIIIMYLTSTFCHCPMIQVSQNPVGDIISDMSPTRLVPNIDVTNYNNWFRLLFVWLGFWKWRWVGCRGYQKRIVHWIFFDFFHNHFHVISNRSVSPIDLYTTLYMNGVWNAHLQGQSDADKSMKTCYRAIRSFNTPIRPPYASET